MVSKGVSVLVRDICVRMTLCCVCGDTLGGAGVCWGVCLYGGYPRVCGCDRPWGEHRSLRVPVFTHMCLCQPM